MGKPKIFVVQPIMPECLEALRLLGEVEVFESERMISRPELRDGVADADYLYTLGDTTIDADIFDAAPRLKGVAAMAMGVKGVIDVDAATERGILVTKIDHVIGKTTADLAMTHILALAWRLVEADHFTRSGRFRQEQSMSFLCDSIPGKVLGLVGLGEIGAEVAKRARAFEMSVLYFKRNRLSESEERELGVTWVDGLHELLEKSDFVALMADYNPTTHLLIGAAEFSRMKPSAFLVNTARGRIVDEGALVEALRSGTIAGAGLDVYWGEPPVSEPNPHPDLLKMDNVIVTPHMGSATKESRRVMAGLAVENIAAMIRGETPSNTLNPEVASHPRQRASSGVPS